MTLFPNASDAFRALNPDLDNTGSPAELERCAGDDALEAPRVEEANQGVVYVRVVSVRKRELDEDNICEKYHVDCCRYAGLIRDDSPAEVRIITTQRKAEKGEEEHTIIEITK